MDELENIRRIEKNMRITQLNYDNGKITRDKYDELNRQGKRGISSIKKKMRESTRANILIFHQDTRAEKERRKKEDSIELICYITKNIDDTKFAKFISELLFKLPVVKNLDDAKLKVDKFKAKLNNYK
jgi:RecG-like helicase